MKPTMTYRDGQFAGSSARNEVLVLVKSTRGEIDFQPRSMPLRMVAEAPVLPAKLLVEARMFRQ